MDAKVGARIEIATPRPLVAAPDAGRLLLLVLAAAAVHVWVVRHTSVTARDSLGFARMALNLENPAAGGPASSDGRHRTFIDVLKAAEHPPGYPLAVLAASKVVRQYTPGPVGEQMLLSCQVASSIAGILLVIPTFLLGRILFDRTAGFAAALLFQVLPVVARDTSDGLTEGLFLLCVSTALYFAVRAVRHRSTLNFLLTGGATGLSYLVRPEGLMVVLAAGAVTACLGVVGRWPRAVAAGRLTALAVGVVLVAGPYMALIGGLTNKSNSANFFPALNPRAKAVGSRDADPVLFAAWYDPARDGSINLWPVKAVATEVWKTSHFAPCVLALVGLAAARRRLFAEPELAVPVALVVVNLAVLYALGMKSRYVSERHTLLITLVISVFAAGALGPVARFLAGAGLKVGEWGLLAALVASALPATLRPLHENRVGHYHAGKYLEGVLRPEDVLVDPFCWAGFYSGREVFVVPPDPNGAMVVYAVVEPGKDNPHSRLPRLPAAQNVAADGWSEIVYHWPENVRPEDAKVQVVKLDRGSQDAVRAAGGGPVSIVLNRRPPANRASSPAP